MMWGLFIGLILGGAINEICYHISDYLREKRQNDAG